MLKNTLFSTGHDSQRKREDQLASSTKTAAVQ